jgi:hypothetical protein
MSSTGIRRWRATDLAADDTLRVAQVVCRHLGELRVPHFITGSLASSVPGVPRATHDADLIALLDERHVNPLAKRLEGDFHFDEDRLRLAIRTKRSCNVIHLPTMTKVDLYVADNSRRSVEAFARVCWIEIGDFTFPVSSAEESILSKLRGTATVVSSPTSSGETSRAFSRSVALASTLPFSSGGLRHSVSETYGTAPFGPGASGANRA